jgi:HlyD family secretion protein
VLVFDPQRGRLEQRHIETGLSNWEFSEVRSGLKQGEQVVISLERKGVAPGVEATPEAAQGKPPAP